MMGRLAASTALVLVLSSPAAGAQERAAQTDDLDVTMHIIVDPDAKLPEEVVRRIPLPERKPETPAAGERPPDAAADGQQRAREAQALGREMAERARQRVQEAAEQREQARRATADERRREPPTPPAEPPRAPGR